MMTPLRLLPVFRLLTLFALAGILLGSLPGCKHEPLVPPQGTSPSADDNGGDDGGDDGDDD